MPDTSWVTAGRSGERRRRGRPPASDSAVTRERIVAAARKVFAESGYDAATFQAIALEIGLTRPAINNYFPSKSALYGEVVRRACAAISDAIRSASEQPALTEQMVEFLRWIRGDGADPALAGFLVQSAIEARHLPQFDGQSQAAVLIEQFIADAVRAAAERSELPRDADPDALADSLIGLAWGAAFQLSRDRSVGDDRANRMIGQLDVVLRDGLLRAG